MSTKDNQDENSSSDLDKKLDHLSINKQPNKLNNDEEINLDNSSAKKNMKKFRILNGEQSASNENLNLNNFENNDSEQQQIKSEQFIPPTLLANNNNLIYNDEDSKNNENNEPDKPKKGRPGRKKGSKIKKLNLDETEDSSIRRRSSRLKVIEEKKDETSLIYNLNNDDNLIDNETNNNLINNKINDQINENMEFNETIKEDNNQDDDQLSNNKKKKIKDKKKTTKKQNDKRKLRRKSSINAYKSDSNENENLDNRPNQNNSDRTNSPNSLSHNNYTNQDLNDLKPEKVKSRWRRNSELELESNNDNFTNDAIPDNTFSNNSEISQSNDNLFSNNNYEQQKNQNKSPSTPENIEPMPEFSTIDYNIYLVEKKQTKFIKEVKKMVCDCILTKEERSRGIMGCGEDCLNRMLMIECGNRCPLDDHCSNKRFFKKEYSKVEAFKTIKKGWGLRAKQSIQPGQFIMEYVGEVIGPQEFNTRVKRYSKEERVHHFFMALKADEIIDATYKGNVTRFVNHSCDPNAETQKWTVNGDLRIGFFSTKFIQSGEEITFDYQFQRYGGYIGGANVSKQVEIEDDEDESDEDNDDTESVKRDKSISKIKEQFEDLALEEEIAKLKASGGLRNRNQTMMLARLMVRAEDTQNRFKLLEIIRNTQESACLRLLIDYHCLQLMWSWMVDPSLNDIDLKAEIIKVLEFLPIPNKTVLKDSKVLDVVEKWSKQKDTVVNEDAQQQQKKETINGEQLTNGEIKEDKKMESDDKINDKLKTDTKKDDNSTVNATGVTSLDNQLNKQNELVSSVSSLLKNYNIIKKDNKTNQDQQQQKLKPNISIMATRLLSLWKDLKEVYRIPRLERQKRHEDEKEADRKALENDSKLMNNTLIPTFRKNLKRPFDTVNGNRSTINYNNYKQNYQYPNYNYSQNDSSTTSTSNKVSKEEHRAYYNIELMRKDYDEAMKQYKKQVQQYTEAIKQQLSMNTGLNTGLSIAHLQPPMPPAPPNVDLNNLATANNNNNKVNNTLLNNHQIPSTNTFNYDNSNKLFGNDEFNNNQKNINYVNNNLKTPGYSNLKDVIIQQPQQHYYSQGIEYSSSLNKTTYTHQSHTSSQQNQQELITYNHLIQPSQQNSNQQKIQQMDYTEQQQSTGQNESHLNEKSWNTLFIELTAGIKSSLIELTNENHILNEQKECNQPDHKIKYNQVEELSEKEIKQLDDLFLIPGTYFVSDKTYFMPCNFINKKGYKKDELIIESNGDFVIPTKELSINHNLSKDWSYSKDKNGYYYYSNKLTNQIQWNVPLETNKIKSLNQNIKDIKDIDIATLNEIIKLSNDLQNESDSNKRLKSDNNYSDFDLQEKLNNNLSEELENKIVRFPNQQPAIKHYSKVKMKEKFKSCLSEHIKNVLNPYRKHDCKVGRILSIDDFKYLARKLTHIIMVKELKHCKSPESLVVSDTVKYKSKEFVKKYMQKFNPFYMRPDDEEDDKEEEKEERSINSPISQYSQQQNSNYSTQNSETNSINTTPTFNIIITNENDLINNLDNLSNSVNLINDNLNENIASYESTNNSKNLEDINASIIESIHSNSSKNQGLKIDTPLTINQEKPITVNNILTESINSIKEIKPTNSIKEIKPTNSIKETELKSELIDNDNLITKTDQSVV